MKFKMLNPFRILIAANEAVYHWWAQRLTAIILVPLSIWFVYSLTFIYSADYENVTSWISNTKNSVLMLFFILTLNYHAILGLQVVIEDYIESNLLRKVLLILVKVILVIAILSSVIAIFSISIGF